MYACFDLIGRTYIRQDLTWKQILPVGIISYAFNLNLSAWVGGIAMRYRLYSRLGVSKRQHRENPRPEPGDQLVRLHGHCRRGVQQRAGAHAAGLEAQQ